MGNDEKPIRKRRRWPWIVLAILLGIPACALIVLKMIFVVHSIPKDLMRPPAVMLRIKPTATAPTTTITLPDQLDTSYEKYREASQQVYIALEKAKHPDSEALRLYEKWRPFMNEFSASKIYSEVFDHWGPDQPLNEKQVKLLLAHQDFIRDMLRMAKFGGFPGVTCEEAAAMTDAQISALGRCYSPGNHAVFIMLAAESRRLRDAGDPAGAAEMLMAINPLAESIGEPFLGHQVGETYPKSVGLAAIENWMQHSMPPETAKKLRDELAGRRPIDPRRGWETMWRAERYQAVNLLSRSAWEIFKIRSGARDKSVYDILADCTETPLNLFRVYGYGMAQSIDLKSSADRSIQDLDRFYSNIIEHSAPGAGLDWTDRLTADILARKYSNYVMEGVPDYIDLPRRIAIFQSRLNMDLIALDQIAGRADAAPDAFTDPFNHGRPFKRIDQTTATLIYSIGPDRTDDHASFAYDPTNGSSSAGDVFVRVPKK